MTPRPGEPAWTEDDIEYVLEWQRMQDALCSGCGQPRDESFSADYADAYVASMQRCHACAAKERKARDSQSLDEPFGLYAAVSKEHQH